MRTHVPASLALLVGATAALALTACGGGGNSSTVASTPAPSPAPAPGPAPSPAPATSSLSGVVATGAAFANAALVVTDQRGTVVCTVTTATDGSYGCTLPVGTVAPLVISATRDDRVLYSVTAAVGGTANVTPLTTIIAAQLAPNGDPAGLAAAVKANASVASASALQARTNQLLAALKPLNDALGLGSINPITDVFIANGTGADKLLDSVNVTVRQTGTEANVSIGVKTSDGSVPATTFSTATPATTALPALPAVSGTAVATLPKPDAVAALLQRINACFALPLSQRVATATSDTGSAIGTAADVKAPACRTLFTGDNPANYLSSGSRVGRNANNQGSFAGLFRSGATGLVYDRGVAEYQRQVVTGQPNSYVISTRWTDTVGNIDYDTFSVVEENGALKLAGNGYVYSASVRPQSENRELINSPAFSYYTTGYTLGVDNVNDGNGNSIFSKVDVTGPAGDTYSLVPQPGLSYLVINTSAGASGTSIVRYAAGWQNSSTTGSVGAKETSLVFASPVKTDADIAALADQGVWTMVFHHVDSGTADVTQRYRTLSRPATLAELAKTPFATFTPALMTELLATTASTGVVSFGAPSLANPNIVDVSANGNTDAWTVPTGALAPTSLVAYGRAPFGSTTAGVQGARFNDSITVRSTVRKGVITCTAASSADRHCDNSTGVLQYANGSSVNTFELAARTGRQVDVSKKIGLYRVQ